MSMLCHLLDVRDRAFGWIDVQQSAQAVAISIQELKRGRATFLRAGSKDALPTDSRQQTSDGFRGHHAATGLL